ncbi:MAG: hypothetical protein ACYTG5_16950 [Planctomycetota bacterium]|jgi:hypothetical protein
MADQAAGKASPPAAGTKQTVRSSSAISRFVVPIHCFLAAYSAGVLWVTANTWRLATIANTNEAPAPILADQIQYARTIAVILILASAGLGAFLGAKKGGMRLALFLAYFLAAALPLVMEKTGG